VNESKRASRIARYHARARERGVNPVVYWIARGILQPFFHLYFRLSRIGREHIPESGPVIFASNHRSFLDPFILGVCSRRPIYYVAKREIFANPIVAWLVSSLGAFPVRRGERDVEAIATAVELAGEGNVVAMFPHGTRQRKGLIKRHQPKAHTGAARIALDAGVPLVPAAIGGTDRLSRLGPLRVRYGRPILLDDLDGLEPSEAARVATDRLMEEIGRLEEGL
jgi:1-acyl-sn-glycerol-3-phosphate acyltransferase